MCVWYAFEQESYSDWNTFEITMSFWGSVVVVGMLIRDRVSRGILKG